MLFGCSRRPKQTNLLNPNRPVYDSYRKLQLALANPWACVHVTHNHTLKISSKHVRGRRGACYSNRLLYSSAKEQLRLLLCQGSWLNYNSACHGQYRNGGGGSVPREFQYSPDQHGCSSSTNSKDCLCQRDMRCGNGQPRCVCVDPMAELEMCQQLVVRVAITTSGTGWGLQCAHDAGCWYSCWHGSHCSLQLRP